MMERCEGRSLRFRARMIGVVYLLYFVTAILGEFFLKGLVVADNAAATAHNILAHEALFQLGSAVGLIATALYIVLAALFYELFRPVNRSLSLLAAFFSLTGCAIQAFGGIFQLASLAALQRASYPSVFDIAQAQALSMLFLKLHAQVASISLVFFGFYDLLIGYLIFRSAFLPRVLGVLMMFAGLGWLTFLAPTLANHLSPGILVLGFVAELLLMLWLLVKGVNVLKVGL
jgi:hypothetical protein